MPVMTFRVSNYILRKFQFQEHNCFIFCVLQCSSSRPTYISDINLLLAANLQKNYVLYFILHKGIHVSRVVI
jgi:hypothetical protein